MAPRKKDYFRSIATVSQAFGTTYDQETLLQLIVRSAVDTMDGKAACLFLAGEKAGMFTAVAQTGLSDRYLHAGHGHAETITPLLLKKGHIHFRDAVSDSRLENRAAKKAEGIGSILAVPVLAAQEVIGVLSLYTAKVRDFSPEEISFLSILAEQGGMAIEHARLIEKLRRQTRIFLDLAAQINASFDVKAILQTLTEEVAKALAVKGATIRLLNDSRTELKLVASYGLSDAYLKKGPIYAEKSIAAALKGSPVVVRNAGSDRGVQYKKEKEQEGIVSILCVPIKAKEDVIGVLRLYSGVEREFHEDEITLVSALAYQGGLAIQNAGLYLRLQQDLKSMKDDAWSHRSWF